MGVPVFLKKSILGLLLAYPLSFYLPLFEFLDKNGLYLVVSDHIKSCSLFSLRFGSQQPDKNHSKNNLISTYLAARGFHAKSPSSSFHFPWFSVICSEHFQICFIFSNLFSPLLATPLFILWISSLLLTFPHNECSLKYFKLRSLLPF